MVVLHPIHVAGFPFPFHQQSLEGLSELRRHIHPATLATLRGGELAVRERPLHGDEAGLKVEVAPLKPNDPQRRDELEAERLYLQEYINALGQVAMDSKFEAFQQRLVAVIEGHRVIVFTQYLDTLDFIRDQLVARYGNRMACYSGRGGEVWDP